MSVFEQQYPWSELVPGSYVWDANNVPWKLIEEHPDERGTFKAVSVEGTVSVLRDPGKPVRATVPDFEDALAHLHRILEIRFFERNLTLDPLPPRSKAKIKSHLEQLHGEYIEPSMKIPEMIACHEAAHGRGKFTIPHTHEGMN